MGGLFKYFMCGLFAFACYNEFVLMNRTKAFDTLSSRVDRAGVEDVLGEPKHEFQCDSTEQPPAFLAYIDSLCKEKVVKVDAYAMCHIPMRCRGWHYVAFDQKDKVVNKYRLAN